MKLFAPTVKSGLRAQDRLGAVGLILVLILALLVGTFAASLGRRAADERRNQYQQQKIAILHSAIDTIAASGLEGDVTIRLPLDQTSNSWVIVETVSQEDSSSVGIPVRQYQATLYRNNQPGLFIRRQSRSDP